jgi:predicted DNA-binding transcriptional regulator AlpA
MPEHRLLSFSELRSRKGIGFSRQHLGDLMRRGIFPKSVKTPGGGHINFWVESEIDAYIDRLIKTRDSAPPDEAAARRVARMLAGRQAKKAARTVTIVARRKTASNK